MHTHISTVLGISTTQHPNTGFYQEIKIMHNAQQPQGFIHNCTYQMHIFMKLNETNFGKNKTVPN